MDIHTLGLDIGKTSFSFVGLNASGEQVTKRTCSRPQLFRWLTDLKEQGHSFTVAMEACASSSWLAEQIQGIGFPTKMLPAQYVKAFATARQKNDVRDALSIARAARDPEIRPVPSNGVRFAFVRLWIMVSDCLDPISHIVVNRRSFGRPARAFLLRQKSTTRLIEVERTSPTWLGLVIPLECFCFDKKSTKLTFCRP